MGSGRRGPLWSLGWRRRWLPVEVSNNSSAVEAGGASHTGRWAAPRSEAGPPQRLVALRGAERQQGAAVRVAVWPDARAPSTMRAVVRASSVLTPAQLGMLVVGYVLLGALAYLYLASAWSSPPPGCGACGRSGWP